MLKMNFFMKTPLFLLILLLSLTSLADGKTNEPWFTSKDLLVKNKAFFELFGGAIYPGMTYSMKSFNGVKQDLHFSYEAGVAMRFQRGKWFSFSPRLSFFGQGIAMNDDVNYRLDTKYIGFTFPVELQFDLKRRMNKSTPKFFFFAGPYIATPLSVHIETNNLSKQLTRTEMNTINYGVDAGVGLRIPTFSLEGRSNINVKLSYLQGLNDTYTAYERNLSDQSKAQLYVNDGKRFNSGIKLTVCIEIPLKAKKMISFTAGGDGKKNYKRVIVVDEK